MKIHAKVVGGPVKFEHLKVGAMFCMPVAPERVETCEVYVGREILKRRSDGDPFPDQYIRGQGHCPLISHIPNLIRAGHPGQCYLLHLTVTLEPGEQLPAFFKDNPNVEVLVNECCSTSQRLCDRMIEASARHSAAAMCRELQDKITDLENRLTASNRSREELGKKLSQAGQTIVNLERRKAELGTEVCELHRDRDVLKGRVAELERERAMTRETESGEVRSLKAVVARQSRYLERYQEIRHTGNSSKWPKGFAYRNKHGGVVTIDLDGNQLFIEPGGRVRPASDKSIHSYAIIPGSTGRLINGEPEVIE